MQISLQYRKPRSLMVHNLSAVLAYRLYTEGAWLSTLIRYNITFTTTDILKMVKVHINNSKHITIANMYIPPRYNNTKQLTWTYNTAYSTS